MNKKKTNKYDLGSFVKANQSGLGTGLGFASGLLNSFQDPNQANAGLDISSGALSGASAGLAFGPLGAGIGGVVGGVAGLIGSGAKKRRLEKLRQDNISNGEQDVISNMTNVNNNMYGNYELGGMIEDPGKGKKLKPNKKIDKPLWDKDHPLMVEKADGSIGQWGNPLIPTNPNYIIPTPQIPLSEKAKGNSDLYYPANNVRQGADIPTQYRSANFYAEGGDILSTEINIEKGEIRIDPNTGKVINEYNGINPITGGLYEPHAKGKKSESQNNMTIANEGDFIITKAKAKDYKKSLDNNDKIARETILMNIRNNKLEKEGGLQSKAKYALGDFVRNPLLAPAINPQFNISSYQTNLPTPVSTDIRGSYTPSAQPVTQGSNNVLDNVTKFAPSIYNIGQGLFGKVDNIGQQRRVNNPYLKNVLGNLPQDVNLQPVINDINLAAEGANRDILNNTNNSAVYRANRQQLASNTGRQLAGVRLQQQDMNNQIRSQRAGIYSNLGAQDMQEQARVRDLNLNIDNMNRQNRGAKDNLLTTGLSQLQQTVMNEKANSQKAAMDKYQLDLLKQIYPSIAPYDVFSPSYLKR